MTGLSGHIYSTHQKKCTWEIFIFSFYWFPFRNYLEIHITPKYSQMFSANFPPCLDAIKTDLERWPILPLSWLKRTSIIKIHFQPREIICPLQMIQ